MSSAAPAHAGPRPICRNGHADVFLPISPMTERSGHYTNFQGTVSAFEACFARPPGVLDAEALFGALARP